MKLSKRARKIFTIVTPWGLYEHLPISMGIVMLRNVFQARLASLFTHLLHVLVYIENLTINVYSIFEEHLFDIQEVLLILCNLCIQVNPANYIWAEDEI